MTIYIESSRKLGRWNVRINSGLLAADVTPHAEAVRIATAALQPGDTIDDERDFADGFSDPTDEPIERGIY